MEPLLIFAIVASAVLPFVPCLLCLFVTICKCDKTCNRCDVLGTIYEDPLHISCGRQKNVLSTISKKTFWQQRIMKLFDYF